MPLNMHVEQGKFQYDCDRVACYPYTQEAQAFMLSLSPTEFPLRRLLTRLFVRN